MSEPASEPMSVRRILGNGPFAEIGEPTVAVRCEERGLVAVGGDLGRLSWPGRSVSGWGGRRLAVYGTGEADCRLLVRTDRPVNALAFHPHLPLLAAGTGEYDGGYLFEGELLLVDLTDGSVVSALEHGPEVRRVRWREDGRALELVVSPFDEEAAEQPFTHGFAAVVEREDWRAVTDRSIPAGEITGPQVEAGTRPDGAEDDAREMLTGLAEAQDTYWFPRRQVWAVEALADGRVLAALEGTKLESWLPSGELEWRLLDRDGARQLSVCPGEESVWVNMAGRPAWTAGYGWRDVPGQVERISLVDADTLDTADIDFPAALTGDLDGRIALRDTRHGDRSGPTVLLTPEHREHGRVAVGNYDTVNHYFPVRHSPELLFLQGGKKKHWEDKWVVAVDPRDDADRLRVRRLFPLEWDSARRHHLFGGPAVRLTGEGGEALVHAGEDHDNHIRRQQRAFIVRRSFPDGAPQWIFTADHPVTALDTDGVTVFAAFLSGEVMALDAADGTVRRRTRLEVDGTPTVALSLTVAGPDRLVLGTVDGRILVTGTTAG
ncbi:hypothetical protein ACFQ6N_34110 [Kitasatospora sp. NPDC056446]|uniref:hypothetical protein n=1 Tax=Kitasatospora sp. NPDC056446 TaxID=3345819 RepID=UPI00368B9F1E